MLVAECGLRCSVRLLASKRLLSQWLSEEMIPTGSKFDTEVLFSDCPGFIELMKLAKTLRVCFTNCLLPFIMLLCKSVTYAAKS